MVNPKSTLIVLGSSDPEMRAIQDIGVRLGCHVLQATAAGAPVAPGQLSDDAFVARMSDYCVNNGIETVLMVEQPGRWTFAGSWKIEYEARLTLSLADIDHHDPQQVWPDDMPLWRRSSIGQLADKLGYELDRTEKAIGALDHSLPAALREAEAAGELDFYLTTYCNASAQMFGGVPPEVYKRQAMDTAERLRFVPTRTIAGSPCKAVYRLPPDPATQGQTGEVYPLPALPLALAMLDCAGLSVIKRRDNELAWRLQCATEAQVRYFMNEFPLVVRGKPSPDNVYGFPARGMAGGLVDPTAVELLEMAWKR